MKTYLVISFLIFTIIIFNPILVFSAQENEISQIVISHYNKGLTALESKNYYGTGKEFNIAIFLEQNYTEVVSVIESIQKAQTDNYSEKSINAQINDNFFIKLGIYIKSDNYQSL